MIQKYRDGSDPDNYADEMYLDDLLGGHALQTLSLIHIQMCIRDSFNGMFITQSRDCQQVVRFFVDKLSTFSVDLSLFSVDYQVIVLST